MKNINIRNATRSDIHQLVYLRKQYLIEKYGVKEIENDNMLFFQIQRYFNEHVDKDIDIVVAEADTNIIGVFCVSYLQLLRNMKQSGGPQFTDSLQWNAKGAKQWDNILKGTKFAFQGRMQATSIPFADNKWGGDLTY